MQEAEETSEIAPATAPELDRDRPVRSEASYMLVETQRRLVTSRTPSWKDLKKRTLTYDDFSLLLLLLLRS